MMYSFKEISFFGDDRMLGKVKFICNYVDMKYYDRRSQALCTEQVYGRRFLNLLYGRSGWLWPIGRIFRPLITRFSLFSRWAGMWQRREGSKKNIIPFITAYGIDTSEFAEPILSFKSFNDFFIRKLLPSARPVDTRDHVLAAPVDGRYLVMPNIRQSDCFFIKRRPFQLAAFLQDRNLAQHYEGGALVIARLNPTDYHRIHFPASGKVLLHRAIQGAFFSVNPIALWRRWSILWENKRELTLIDTPVFGLICMVEIGATCVGSIHQTFSVDKPVVKGEEKGCFSFGGSCVALLLEKKRIAFDQDILYYSQNGTETKCLFGSSIGTHILHRA
jgi:phosphatidylserine decarboxylase